MAKRKTFKDNPALQFITMNEAEEPEQDEVEVAAAQIQETPAAALPQAAPKTPPAPKPQRRPAAARAGAAERSAPSSISLHTEPVEGIPMKPLYIETKSKRVQLLMRPSLYAYIHDQAQRQGTSVNELIHLVLEDYAKQGGSGGQK